MVFLDSNIWLYALSAEDSRKHRIASGLTDRNDLVISVQNIAEVCNVLLKKAKYSEETVQMVINDFVERYAPLSLEPTHLLKASSLRKIYKLSHWDSLLIAAALELGAEIFYSEDMQDGLVVESSLTIRNPFI